MDCPGLGCNSAGDWTENAALFRGLVSLKFFLVLHLVEECGISCKSRVIEQASNYI